MIKIWIHLFLSWAIWQQVVAFSGITCPEKLDSQEWIKSRTYASSKRNVYDGPLCDTPSICESLAEVNSDISQIELPGIMASIRESIEYHMEAIWVEKKLNPDMHVSIAMMTGYFPRPFYVLNLENNKFELAAWDPHDLNKFKFRPKLVGSMCFFSAERSNNLFHPSMPFDWIATNNTNSKIIHEQWYSQHLAMPRAAIASCGCGFHDAIHMRGDYSCDNTMPDCYINATSRQIAVRATPYCYDVDECAEGIDNCYLRPNTHCVNTVGSFRCDCDEGYVLSGTTCVDYRNPVVSRAETTSTSAQVFVISKDLSKLSWSYSYNVTDVSNPSYPLPVYKATQVKVSQLIAKSGVHISNLNPGTNYSITWDIVDENNTVITDRYPTPVASHFTTLCTCSFQTDAPILLGNETIRQEKGNIYFKFLGNSMCGNAYTFARQSFEIDGSLSKQTVFTPNYFFTGGECSAVPYEPGESASDVLANSKLTVGAQYRYSIRAVGSKYLGDSSYMDFKVRWESSITGFVGLKPLYGDLPVEGVVVRWLLKDENGTTVLDGMTITSKSGRFTIHPNVLVPFKNDRDYPMHLSFSKVSEIDDTHKVKHEFLCSNGRVNCTDTNLIIHLKHLDFDVPVNVIDATSVPVSGKIYVADTKTNSDGTMWGRDGCPIANAKVCLIDRSPSGFQNELTCTETASDGGYTLAGVIGSIVSINVTFNNHTFEYVPRNGFPDFRDGIEIQPQHIYEHNDFKDTSTVPLDLTIAGGICDFPLGNAVISYKIQGCNWGGRLLHQAGLRQRYDTIPAQNLIFSVDSIEKRPDIQMPAQGLDLQKLPSNDESSSLDEPPVGDSDNITQLRFQYNGIGKIRVVFHDDMNTDCKVMTPDIASLNANSIHVLPFQRHTTAMIFLERDLGAGVVCDAVDPSFQVLIQNNLGLQFRDSSDDAYAAAIAASVPTETMALLYHCNQGCLVNVTHDYDAILKRNARARVEFQFMTGRPNNAEPFVKRFIVKTQETNSVSYNAAVVITGQYNRGDLYTVALPTYEPIMIIRDPPGGTSYTFYENVQTTLRVESHQYKEYTGLDAKGDMAGGIKMSTGSCVGLGLAACNNVISVQALASVEYSSSKYDLTTLNSKVFSGGLTTSWSYKTSSSNPIFTGNMSDTYVIPNLNMKFSIIDTVSWNQSTCAASVTEENAYNLQSPENVPTFTFVTGAEIMWTEIPSLKLSIDSVKNKLEQSTTEAQRVQLETELVAFQDALQAWHDALTLNEALKQQAIHGDAQFQVKPHQWFDKVASKAFFNKNEEINTDGMSHNSALLSEDWMARAKLRQYYDNAQGSKTDLESTNTIKFAGGGGEFSFVLSASKMKQHMSNLGDTKKSVSYVGGGMAGEMTLTGIHSSTSFTRGYHNETDRENLQKDETSASTTIGFVFSDPDAGDQFDVEVFIDPVFGTFVFHTKSGKSGCKHEPGTESRQEIEIELVSVPPTVVFEDEPMVFHFRVTRTGMGSGSYMLQQELREDVDALAHYPFLPREYPVLEYGQSFIGTLELRRGPEKYEYPAYTLFIQPSCEYGSQVFLGAEATIAKIELYNYIDPVDQSKKIVFARPCAPVVLQGDIAKDEKFMITSSNPNAPVNVVVQNPEASLTTWAAAVRDSKTRLKRVQLYYRPVGTTRWSIGQHLVNDQLVDIDFALAGIEDAYGYATIGWKVSHLADGNYEMQVRTVCDDVTDAPAIFNGQETDIIQGVIDRKPPKLYGLPQPQIELPIGQPITLTFDEPLDCSLPLKFEVELIVGGLERVFDNSNLMLICEDRVISVQFDSQSIDLHDMVGKHLSMTVTSIMDTNSNLMTKPVSYSVDIVAAGNSPVSHRRQLDESYLKEDVEELRREIEKSRREMVAMVSEIKESIRSLLVQQIAL